MKVYISGWLLVLFICLVLFGSANASPGYRIETETPTITCYPQYFFLVTATPDPHPLPPSIQIVIEGGPKDVNEAIDTIWPWLIAREKEYFEMTGRYCQMLPSHLSVVKEGSHEYPDGWYSHPHDQQYSWNDLNAIQYEPLPFTIYIDVYDGVEGKGFVSCFRVGESIRCKNYGPEALRNTDWEIFEEEE